MVCGSAQYVPQHGISFVISKTSAFPSYSSLPWLPFYSTVFSSSFICYMNWAFLRHVKRISRRRRRRDVEGQYYASSSDEVEEESSSSTCNDEVSRIEKKRRHRRDYKRNHVTRSLRPRSHRVRVGVNGNSGYITRNNSSKHWDDHDSSVHSIRVAQTSKFARKGSSFKGSKHRKRR
ncbi:hypothetical protein ACET3Z_003327 [Daucus carota]